MDKVKGRKPFFLVHRSGYDYCLESKEVLSLKGTVPGKGEVVPFVFNGKKYKEGSIIMISADESDILQAMKRRLKERKQLRRSCSSSFDRSKPRKAFWKQRGLGMEADSSQRSDNSKVRGPSQKSVTKQKRDQAEHQMEEEMTGECLNSSIDGMCQSDSEEGSSADMSSKGAREHREIIKLDIARLHDLQTSSSSEEDSSAIRQRETGEDAKTKEKDSENTETEQDSAEGLKVSGRDVEGAHTQTKEKLSMTTQDVEDGNANASTTQQIRSPKADDNPSSSDGMETEPVSVYSSSSEKRKHRRLKHKLSKSRYSSFSDENDDLKCFGRNTHRRSKHVYPTPSCTESSSSDSDDKRTKKVKVQRNLDVFPGSNYLWKENDVGVVKVHEKFNVYIKQEHLEVALSGSRSPMQFIRAVVDKVYTYDALCGSTACGFPPRGKGAKHLRKTKVLPRLHPDGRTAIIARAKQLEDEHKAWRPRVGVYTMNQAFSSRVGEF